MCAMCILYEKYSILELKTKVVVNEVHIAKEKMEEQYLNEKQITEGEDIVII